MSQHTLKPCPFCGEQPTINHIEAHSHSFQINGFKMPDHPGSCVIECTCGAGLIDSDFDTVAARWNARALPALEAKQEPAGHLYYIKSWYEGRNVTTFDYCLASDKGIIKTVPVYEIPPDAEALRKENEQLRDRITEIERISYSARCALHADVNDRDEVIANCSDKIRILESKLAALKGGAK